MITIARPEASAKKLTEMEETYEHEEINLKIIQNAENFSLELFQNSFRVVDELRLCVFQLKTKKKEVKWV